MASGELQLQPVTGFEPVSCKQTTPPGSPTQLAVIGSPKQVCKVSVVIFAKNAKLNGCQSIWVQIREIFGPY